MQFSFLFSPPVYGRGRCLVRTGPSPARNSEQIIPVFHSAESERGLVFTTNAKQTAPFPRGTHPIVHHEKSKPLPLLRRNIRSGEDLLLHKTDCWHLDTSKSCVVADYKSIRILAKLQPEMCKKLNTKFYQIMLHVVPPYQISNLYEFQRATHAPARGPGDTFHMPTVYVEFLRHKTHAGYMRRIARVEVAILKL